MMMMMMMMMMIHFSSPSINFSVVIVALMTKMTMFGNRTISIENSKFNAFLSQLPSMMAHGLLTSVFMSLRAVF